MFNSNASSANGAANYIEDVFSTYLYTGNGSTQTITNNIDLSTKGGMVWLKARTSGGSSSTNNSIIDTARGANAYGYYSLYTNLTDSQFSPTGSGDAVATAVSTTGFTVGGNANVNYNTQTDVSWTFRKQPKFFDVVTYTGDGATSKTISHSLGSTPGCIIVKRTDTTGGWATYHKQLNGGTTPQNYYMYLNSTNAQTASSAMWNNTAPTSTQFTVGNDTYVNASGGTYVAYIFAHDAGGFGLTGTDNVITCGSYTGNGSATGPTVTLGYEPQWLMVKRTDSTSGADWYIFDNMRGMSFSSANVLQANASSAESTTAAGAGIIPTATGFQPITTAAGINASAGTYIYIAIRRGPMKVPTDGTTVYSSALFTGNGVDGRDVTSSVNAPDFFMLWDRANNYGLFTQWFAKLAGSKHMISNSTAAEVQGNASQGVFTQTGIQYASSGADTNSNVSGVNYDNFAFKRAPGFMDIVCFTGTGTYPSVTHNLQVTPELVIQKTRNTSAAYTHWWVWCPNTNIGWSIIDGSGAFNTGEPSATSTTFNLLSDTSGHTYVNYLFATCAGVSKVGSYTGTGTTQQINCGFTAGARFIMIKRTDSTGDWYVYDSARGIVAGNDPYLLLNSTAAEVTSTDYVDTYAAGFELSSTAPAALNASGGTFIFLAIA